VPPAEQQEMFIKKLRQSQLVFDFLDATAHLKSKEVKRATLNELIDHVTSGKGVLTEPSYPEIIKMVLKILHIVLSIYSFGSSDVSGFL